MGSEKKPISNSPPLKWEVKRSPSPALPAGERDVDGGDDAYLKLKGGKREKGKHSQSPTLHKKKSGYAYDVSTAVYLCRLT